MLTVVQQPGLTLLCPPAQHRVSEWWQGWNLNPDLQQQGGVSWTPGVGISLVWKPEG